MQKFLCDTIADDLIDMKYALTYIPMFSFNLRVGT